MTTRLQIRLAALGSCLVLGSLGLASPAHAQALEIDDFGPVESDAVYETPQTMAVELRFGPYLPNIDDEFAGQGVTPFATHYGKDADWMPGFEVDWQLLRLPKLASLGPAFGWGMTSFSGKGFTDAGVAVKQKTSLSIMPMHLAAVLRVDAIAQNTLVPFTPYAKAGLGYALWWTSDCDDAGRPSLDGAKCSGKSHGYVWALGGMLLLDTFSRGAASNLDATYGVNNSYLFVEWFNSDLDGFNSGKHMQVGVNTWMAGITLEM
ncbi:MAG: hypothetical protein RJA70_4877 [Pseudomonadota bacterium]|jgi:hypothetical protein